MTKQTSAQGRSPAWRVGFVGAGNMATALVKGLLAAAVHTADEIVASDVDGAKLAVLKRRFKIATTADNLTLVRRSRVVVLAVKPQIIDEVLAQIRPAVTPRQLFVSIAAGISTARLERGLGSNAPVLRVMPNTPALLGQGMSVLVRGRYASTRDERVGLRLLRAVGDALAVGEERLLDPVTGLSGSGPAYVYLVAEGLIAGGVAAGLAPDLAKRLAYQTLTGAAAMLRETGESPEALRAMVTSPGGTTFAGLGVLQERGFKDALIAAVVAATRRAEELGRPTG
jgi:pyrroline-5-carboxylate reductase